MKRLLRICLDTLLTSLTPILSWIILSIFVEKSLINVFVLTYPLQYISCILKSVFATGANISKDKYKNKNDVLSAMTIGIAVSFLIFGLLIINIDHYIYFMNTSISINKTFVVYSIVQLFLQSILNYVLTKLYFEGKNILANKYSIAFNILSLSCVLLTSILLKEQTFIVILTLSILALYITIIVAKSYANFKLNINLLKWIKYDSVELSNNLFLFLAFLFGLSAAINYGEKYAIALTFIALVTDTQWDISEAIPIVAKIDISNNNFNYKVHKNNAYKLVLILLVSAYISFTIFYRLYDVNIYVALGYLCFHSIDFIICPIYKIKTCFLQLEYSETKTTANNLLARFLRLLLSFLPTPFCTVIAQVGSSIYQSITMNIIFNKAFKINNSGIILKK